MSNWLETLLLLAEDAAAKKPPETSWMNSPLTLVPLVALAFYVCFIMPNRAERKKREKLMDATRKNARIVTRGGIIGTVVENAADSNEITIRVNDSTRIKIVKSAVDYVIPEKSEESSGSKSSGSK